MTNKTKANLWLTIPSVLFVVLFLAFPIVSFVAINAPDADPRVMSIVMNTHRIGIFLTLFGIVVGIPMSIKYRKRSKSEIGGN